jgi:hypothetical protein
MLVKFFYFLPLPISIESGCFFIIYEDIISINGFNAKKKNC